MEQEELVEGEMELQLLHLLQVFQELPIQVVAVEVVQQIVLMGQLEEETAVQESLS